LSNEIASTGRFVIVDDHDIRGGGIILEDLKDKQVFLRDKRFLRDYKWERSLIPPETRVEKYGQRPTLIVITGEKDSGKKPLQKRLEASLFEEGKLVYFLSIGNLLYGMDADIKWQGDGRQADDLPHRQVDAAGGGFRLSPEAFRSAATGCARLFGLELGAVEIVPKPGTQYSVPDVGRHLVHALRAAAVANATRNATAKKAKTFIFFGRLRAQPKTY
jgi:hypothetical protein